LSFQNLAEILSAVVGRPISYVNIPLDAAKEAMQARGMG
jgi:uncharacterized protein YbjT (DUF2867 family)